ncbi:MAG: amidohydrolase family protein [Bacillota bacterium]
MKKVPFYDAETCYYAAMIGCLESIHSGTTTVLDYMYFQSRPRLNDAVIKAFRDTGIRGILGRGYTSLADLAKSNCCEIIETVPMFLEDTKRLLMDYPVEDNDLLSIFLAPGIIWDLTIEELLDIRKFADEHRLSITMHLVETEDDDTFTLQRHNKRTIELLDEIGFLGPDVIAVHCVHMQPSDIDIFRKHDVKISYNPTSNMILASGVAPIKQFMDSGLTVSLASDGAASNDSQDMIETMKNATLLQKVFSRDASLLPAPEVLKMATINGARAIGKEKTIGSLEVGKRADMFIFNPWTSKTVPMHDPVSALVYSAGEDNVETTIINGRVVMEKKKMLLVDEDEVLKKAAAAAVKLRKNAGI